MAGWKLEQIISENGAQFRRPHFQAAIKRHGVQHRRIRAQRPTSNGHIERLQRTILEECWRPAFARTLIPKKTALEVELLERAAGCPRCGGGDVRVKERPRVRLRDGRSPGA